MSCVRPPTNSTDLLTGCSRQLTPSPTETIRVRKTTPPAWRVISAGWKPKRGASRANHARRIPTTMNSQGKPRPRVELVKLACVGPCAFRAIACGKSRVGEKRQHRQPVKSVLKADRRRLNSELRHKRTNDKRPSTRDHFRRAIVFHGWAAVLNLASHAFTERKWVSFQLAEPEDRKLEANSVLHGSCLTMRYAVL